MARTKRNGIIKPTPPAIRKHARAEDIKAAPPEVKNGQKKKKNGKPTLYDADNHPRIVYEVCVQFGAIHTQIAKVLGIHPTTLTLWLQKHEELRTEMLKGKEIFDTQHVEASLLKRAIGYQYKEVRTEEIIFKAGRGKQKIEMPADRVTTTVKEVVPDVTAQIFWLKNRDKTRWRDVQERKETGDYTHEHNHKGEVPVIDDSIGRTQQVYEILRAAGGIAATAHPGSKAEAH